MTSEYLREIKDITNTQKKELKLMTIPVTHIMKDQKTDNWIATLKCGETEMIVEDCKLDALTENIKKIHCITTQNIR